LFLSMVLDSKKMAHNLPACCHVVEDRWQKEKTFIERSESTK
jgi:hypothetical protein